ncbi:MAG: hypothetical protein RL268_2025 [Pseudomonadota bacterium]|jgi:RimJ/RimL family protein N-acetyltransferase
MGQDHQPASRGVIRLGNVLFGADRIVAKWVSQRIPGFTASMGATAIGILDGDDLVAGVVYERYNGVHVEASIAALPGRNWASRRALHAIFHYPFVQLGCEAISVLVPSSNLESLNLATKLGFRPEAMVSFAAADGSTLIVLKQFRAECRWIDHGQGQQGTGSA